MDEAGRRLIALRGNCTLFVRLLAQDLHGGVTLIARSAPSSCAPPKTQDPVGVRRGGVPFAPSSSLFFSANPGVRLRGKGGGALRPPEKLGGAVADMAVLA